MGEAQLSIDTEDQRYLCGFMTLHVCPIWNFSLLTKGYLLAHVSPIPNEQPQRPDLCGVNPEVSDGRCYWAIWAISSELLWWFWKQIAVSICT